MTHFKKGLSENLSGKLKETIGEHKNRFKRLFRGRYLELLPNLITYENAKATSIDFLKVEVALRSGRDVVIGRTIEDELMVLGFATNRKTSEDPANFLFDLPLKKDDVTFIVPNRILPENMTEISNLDNCRTGDFVVLRNKTLNFVNDREVISHYTDELAEIVLSRYSLSMQAKINTFFMSDVNDETINQIVADLYNGAPYIKVSKLFDPKDNIFTINNEFLATNFVELKREYQNKISELNNMLGINSLAVEKSSGVSDTEAKSNRAFTTSNANIYLLGRNNPLNKLNKRFDENIYALYNDEVLSEFGEIAYSQESNE